MDYKDKRCAINELDTSKRLDESQLEGYVKRDQTKDTPMQSNQGTVYIAEEPKIEKLAPYGMTSFSGLSTNGGGH